MKKFLSLLALFLALTPALWGQVNERSRIAPDCYITGVFTASSQSSQTWDNTNGALLNSNGTPYQNQPYPAVCTTWHLLYWNNGFSVVSLQFNFAPKVTPTSFSVWPSLASGGLPLTGTTSGQITGYGYKPYVNVSTGSLTGSGTIWYVLLGYAAGAAQDISVAP